MRHWLDTLLLTLFAALAYACLRQDAVHHLDMHGVVRSVVAPPGEGVRYGHFGYQWLVLALHWLLGPDAPLYRPLQWCSVVAAALAVGAGHRACLAIGFDRMRAALVAVGAGGTLTATFFATVAEIHAVFWLPVNVMFWALAKFVRSPRVPGAVLVGALGAAAAAVHSSGHVLPGLMLLAMLAARLPGAAGWGRVAVWWSSMLGTHVAVSLLLLLIDHVCVGFASDAASQGFLAETLARWQGFGALPGIAWREWLQAYAPFSLMALAALLHPSTRAPASACLIAVLGYLAIDLVLLIGLVEHGAYALPLALPLAALTALRFGRAGAAAAAAVAIGIAVPHVLRQDPARVPRPEFARALGAWRVEHPGSTFVLGGYAEIDSMLVYGAPIWHHTILEPEFVVWLEPQRSAAFVRERLVARIRKAAANGGALVFSTEATALFTALPRNLEILSDPRGEFVVETVAAGAFGGIALHPPR
ncbi:MAG: hypothetical protein H6838_01195 [Planctomycetes bacterium]|nr:hypothetical protein [Planctomycetota bacterium]